MKINIERLMNEIDNYSQYGLILHEGINRPSFSVADNKVRNVFIKQLKQMGMTVRIDAIANIWGKLENCNDKALSIVLGSHLDTVPNGGKFDGSLGVLVAKEIIQTIQENGVSINHHLEIVSFTAEEANEYNLSTMGSRALTGKLDYETLDKAVNSNNVKLSTEVKNAGGDLTKLTEIQRKDIAAYLELHIEQGKRLEKENLSIGIVDGIVGIYRDKMVVLGEQNHSGTTMMVDRSDALVASSKIVLEVERIVRDFDSNAVATIGKFKVFPDAANIIPGKVELIIEIRSISSVEREAIKQEINKSLKNIQKRYNVKIVSENMLNQLECSFDDDIVTILQNTAVSLEIPYKTLSSMAGHDATHLAGITKAAMIFVKSIDGKSHSYDELSLSEDIENAANTMLHAVLSVDKKLMNFN